MEKVCDDLQAYLDGTLEMAAGRRFQEHLLRCESCKARMVDLLELDARLDLLSHEGAETKRDTEQDAPSRRSRPVWHRRWARLSVGACGVLTAACAAMVIFVLPRGVPSSVFLADAPLRPIDARIGPPLADRYREYNASLSPRTTLPPPPLADIARLESQHDYTGMATAYLVRGYDEVAEQYLKQAPPSADVYNGFAVIALDHNKLDDALTFVDQALKLQPNHAHALWNQALVLAGLNAPLKAAASFRQVAALNEPGWRTEAERRATALENDVAKRRRSWTNLDKALKLMVENGLVPPLEQWATHPGMMRRSLYDAVRAAPSRDRVLALQRVAEELDRIEQDHTLTAYIRWAAERDFTQRQQLAETYAKLALGRLSEAEQSNFLERLRRSREEDILLGALELTGQAPKHPDEYKRLASATRDSWFKLLAEEVQAEADMANGEETQAESRLLKALSECDRPGHLDLRCEILEMKLVNIYIILHQPSEARKHAKAVLSRARWSNDWSLELAALGELGQIAAYEDKLALTHAYLEEQLAQVEEEVRCRYEEFARPILASVHQKALDFQGVRTQIDLLAHCGEPTDSAHLLVLADLARQASRTGDAKVFSQGLAARRASPTLSRGEAALLDHIEGRFELERNPGLGQSLLRKAIAHANQILNGENSKDVDRKDRVTRDRDDVVALKARVYSYTSLLFDEGKRKGFHQALRLFAEELGITQPTRCALAVTVEDERTLLVLVDAKGEIHGTYDNTRKVPLQDASTVVPAWMVRELQPCDAVQVLARPPLQGQPTLLPSDVAWAYRVSQDEQGHRSKPTHRLLVFDPRLPDEMKDQLPDLDGSRLPTADADTVLRGDQATPSRTIQEMSKATEVFIFTHGMSDPSVSDASFLVLSKDSDSSFRLTARDVQRAKLDGQPVVVLAACYAGQTTRFLHEAHGLPTAFIRAGARVVLASTQPLPAHEASAFFETVLSNISKGMDPAVALRDERQKWLQGKSDSWVKDVVLFE